MLAYGLRKYASANETARLGNSKVMQWMSKINNDHITVSLLIKWHKSLFRLSHR